MRRRASKSASASALAASKVVKVIPPLVMAYKNAMQSVCGRMTYVRSSDYKRFQARQQQLDDIGAPYARYAYTVMKTWHTWCRDKGMPSVPVGIFCGDRAWDRFLDAYAEKPSVRISTLSESDWNMLIHHELSIAQAYIGSTLNGHHKRIIDVRKAYNAVANIQGTNDNAIKEVVSLLAMLYECDADSYDGIIDILRFRRG